MAELLFQALHVTYKCCGYKVHDVWPAFLLTATNIQVVNFIAKNLPSYLNDSSLR